jgi:hypothetical protein
MLVGALIRTYPIDYGALDAEVVDSTMYHRGSSTMSLGRDGTHSQVGSDALHFDGQGSFAASPTRGFRQIGGGPATGWTAGVIDTAPALRSRMSLLRIFFWHFPEVAGWPAWVRNALDTRHWRAARIGEHTAR